MVRTRANYREGFRGVATPSLPNGRFCVTLKYADGDDVHLATTQTELEALYIARFVATKLAFIDELASIMGDFADGV
jgi:hypothetical protein